MNFERTDATEIHESKTKDARQKMLQLGKNVIALSALVFCGILIVIHKAPFSFGSGDHALFHAFGHWINQGEVFTKDFIHFRTPGPYYFYALIQRFFGETQLSTSIALLSEAHIGQVVASFIMALAISKAFWTRSSLLLAVCIGVLFLALPAIYQLRTAIPALALGTYVYYITGSRPERNFCYLVATGILLGLSFWFGQEVSLFLIIAIGAAEISFRCEKKLNLYIKKITAIIAGVAVTLIPILFYFDSVGVDLKELFYNTLYYAFFIQPKGMDSPFPDLNLGTTIFYAWIWVYIGCAFIFSLKNKLSNPVAIVLFSYIGLRMISMLGRSDFLHLLFSISELFILIPITVALAFTDKVQLTIISVIKAASISLMLLLVFWIGIGGNSSALLAIPFILIAYSYSEKLMATKPQTSTAPRIFISTFATLGGAAIVLLLTLPYSKDSINATISTFKSNPINLVLGTQISAERKKETDEVQKIITSKKATNIFSYPIRAEYYALAPRHGTRYVEFAPQTTQDDVRGAISDLKVSRPQLVFRDLDQVSFLSPILHDLSDFIMSNYTSIQIIEGYSHLEVLELKDFPTTTKRLFDNVYTYNTDHTHVTAGTRTFPNGKTVLVIATNKGKALFNVTREGARFVEAKIYPEPGAGTQGTVTVSVNGKTIEQRVSISEGKSYIPLPDGDGVVQITLESSDSEKSVLWEDPKIVAEKNL